MAASGVRSRSRLLPLLDGRTVPVLTGFIRATEAGLSLERLETLLAQQDSARASGSN